MKTSQKIVWAGLLVSAPRLVLAFLQGDGIEINQHIETAIFVATGVGSATVLTLGNGMIAHALSRNIQSRSPLWWFNLCAWVLFLLSAVILIAPTLVAGLGKSQLDAVLGSTAKWVWAITAVAIVELLVAAVVSSDILDAQLIAPTVNDDGNSAKVVVNNAITVQNSAIAHTKNAQIAIEPVQRNAQIERAIVQFEHDSNGAIERNDQLHVEPKSDLYVQFAAMLQSGATFKIAKLAQEWQVAPNTLRNWKKKFEQVNVAIVVEDQL